MQASNIQKNVGVISGKKDLKTPIFYGNQFISLQMIWTFLHHSMHVKRPTAQRKILRAMKLPRVTIFKKSQDCTSFK